MCNFFFPFLNINTIDVLWKTTINNNSYYLLYAKVLYLNIFIKNNLTHIKLFFVGLFYGCVFIAGKIVAPYLPPFTTAFLRFFIALFFLVLFFLVMYGKLPKINLRQIPLILFLGVTGIAANNFFLFLGLKFISASRASMIASLNPAVTAILSNLIFKEKLGKFNFIGIIISLIGALIVISKGDLQVILQEKIGIGELSILGCVVCWSAFTIAGKILVKELKPLIAISYACLAGNLILIIPAILEGELQNFMQYNISVWISIFFMGFFGTTLALVWFYEGIDKIGPSRAAIFINLQPIFATLIAVLILHENISFSFIAGAIFVLSGIYLTNYQFVENKI